jgi:hypothetical protein
METKNKLRKVKIKTIYEKGKTDTALDIFSIIQYWTQDTKDYLQSAKALKEL